MHWCTDALRLFQTRMLAGTSCTGSVDCTDSVDCVGSVDCARSVKDGLDTFFCLEIFRSGFICVALGASGAGSELVDAASAKDALLLDDGFAFLCGGFAFLCGGFAFLCGGFAFLGDGLDDGLDSGFAVLDGEFADVDLRATGATARPVGGRAEAFMYSRDAVIARSTSD
ncbi:hypothetical protein BCR34DRAFT_590183 [Clohesyomyces aquaticus]|uniref:Uncharacterized protein n=1 Tax=Clohesyomyces aquaticus TaxID=1231657 RepID=A0A1Y1ZBZ2_9PLEO|nr:hypothetical protein BCR34DRAFT_590183 [Clohesyomyces aquaticus]